MPVKLDVKPTLDEAAARREANKAERVFSNAAKGIGQSFGKQFSGGLSAASSDVQKLAREYQRMYDKASDAAGKLRVEETKLSEIREKGVSGSRLVAQVEKQQAAARREAAAVRETTAAYKELQSAQRSAPSLSRGMNTSAFSNYGRDAATGFTKSFGDAFKGGVLGGTIGAGVIGVFTGLVDKVQNIGLAAGRAFAGAIESSVKTGIDFQRITNEFQGVTQATNAQMAQMKAKARELGSDVTLPGVSTAEAGKAMTQLVKDGFSVQEAMNGVRGVLELATAGQIDAADAAEILGDNINMFQLHATDATRVADIFASTVNASSVSMRDMQLAMSMGGNMAHGFGMTIEQTAAAIGALGQMGIKGSDAGTLLKTMLKQLTEPSDEVASAFNALGVTIADNKGNFVGFESILGQLTRAAKSMSQMDFATLASKAFGSDAIRGAIFAAKDGDRVYRDMLQSVGRLGAAHQMAAAQMQGWPGVIEGVKNSIEGMQLGIFDAIDSIAKGFGPGILGAFDQVGNWMSAHQPEMISFFTTLGRTAIEMGKSFLIAGEIVMSAMQPMVTVISTALGAGASAIGSFANGLAKVAGMPGIRNLLPAGTADQLKQIGAEMSSTGRSISGFGESWSQMRQGISDARREMSGWSISLAQAGQQAEQAAEFTRALGKAHAEMRGLDIVIKDNTPEVEQNLKNLGVHIERLPNGEVKVIADTSAGQQIIDSWRRQVSGTPVNMPIRPVIADAGEFQSKMMAWINAIAAGQNPGAPPSFDPTSTGPAGIGRGAWGPKGKPPSTGPALPAWAPPLPTKPPKTKGSSSSGGGGGGSSSSVGGGGGAFYFPPDASGVDAAIAFARAQEGKPYGFGSAGPDLYDCSGIISDIYAVLTGKPYSGNERYFTTESNFPALGFERGFVPGAFNIGVRHGGPGGGHMAGTLPNGVNIESGGTGKGVRYGHGAAGAKDFAEQWHLITPDMTGRGSRGGTPVTVTNFGSEAKNDLGQIGTSLADDMGLSEGIPGIVKFITGALANMAFAPAMGALSAVQQAGSAAAAAGGIQLGGKGLFGLGGSLMGAPSGGFSGGFGGFGGGLAGAAGGGLDIHALGNGPAGASPGVAGLGLGGAQDQGFGAPGGVPGAGAAYGFGTGAPGAAFGPAGLTTPKAVGRQMGQDAPKGGGVGFGGGMMGAAMDMASQAGGMAINGMAPGAGAAASMGSQIAMDLMNRTAGFVAQAAGIGAQGVLETLMLSDTPLADPTNTALGRIAIGIAGARPQIPNVAGMLAGGNVAGGTQSGPNGQGGAQPLGQGADPNDPNAKNADGQRPWVNIENFNNGSGNPSDGKQAGNDIAWRGMTQQMGAGAGR